jgi:hypothetical protein
MKLYNEDCINQMQTMILDDKNDLRWHAWAEMSSAFPNKKNKKVVPDFRFADKWCCLYVRNK